MIYFYPKNALTDRSGQTVHTQLSLILEHCKQGLHCLLFHLCLLEALLYGRTFVGIFECLQKSYWVFEDVGLIAITVGLGPIYAMFFKVLTTSFQMKYNDDIWL